MAKSFAQNLRYFRANFFFANFCAIFAHETQWVLRYFFVQFVQNRKYFLRKVHMNKILVLRNLRKFYAKCNFLGTLSKIDILSLELNNWRFIPYKKKILTYEYDNDYTTLNWLLLVTKSLNYGTKINKIEIRECETW